MQKLKRYFFTGFIAKDSKDENIFYHRNHRGFNGGHRVGAMEILSKESYLSIERTGDLF